MRAGEILGFAGLGGFEALRDPRDHLRRAQGLVGQGFRERQGPPAGSVTSAVNAGIGLSPEERKSQGLILDEPLFKNVTLSTFERFARAGYLNERPSGTQHVSRSPRWSCVRPIRTGPPGRFPAETSRRFSSPAGWCTERPVLLLDEPTRGVDVGARAEIYALIRKLAAAGTAIIVVSSEIEEVLGLADNVLVIDDGKVLTQTKASDIDEHGVLDLVMKGSAA